MLLLLLLLLLCSSCCSCSFGDCLAFFVGPWRSFRPLPERNCSKIAIWIYTI
nr:hypothetical protein [Sicyoidochytrium minutum DNA virus]